MTSVITMPEAVTYSLVCSVSVYVAMPLVGGPAVSNVVGDTVF